MRSHTTLFLLLALAYGCGSSASTSGSTPSSSGSERRARESSQGEEYVDEARALYDRAYEEFDDGDCIAAEPLFRRVRGSVAAWERP